MGGLAVSNAGGLASFSPGLIPQGHAQKEQTLAKENSRSAARWMTDKPFFLA